MKVKACSALVSAENHAALPKHRSFRRERCWPCGGAAMKSQINSRNCLMRRHSSALLESGTAWAGLDEGSVTSAMFSDRPARALVQIAADREAESRVGEECQVSVNLGGRRSTKQKK